MYLSFIIDAMQEKRMQGLATFCRVAGWIVGMAMTSLSFTAANFVSADRGWDFVTLLVLLPSILFIGFALGYCIHQQRSKYQLCHLCQQSVNLSEVNSHKSTCALAHKVMLDIMPKSSAASCPYCKSQLRLWPKHFEPKKFRCSNSDCRIQGSQALVNNGSNCYLCFLCDFAMCAMCEGLKSQTSYNRGGIKSKSKHLPSAKSTPRSVSIYTRPMIPETRFTIVKVPEYDPSKKPLHLVQLFIRDETVGSKQPLMRNIESPD